MDLQSKSATPIVAQEYSSSSGQKRRRFCLVSGLIGTVVVCLLATGCTSWDVGVDPVITSYDAGPIPYTKANQYTDSDGYKYVWSSAVGTGAPNDYNYMKMDSSGDVEEDGTLRVMNIRDDIYAVQTRNEKDSEEDYRITFFSLTPTTAAPEDISVDDEDVVSGIAKRCNLGVDGNIGDPYDVQVVHAHYFKGNPSDILAFLKALKVVRFTAST